MFKFINLPTFIIRIYKTTKLSAIITLSLGFSFNNFIHSQLIFNESPSNSSINRIKTTYDQWSKNTLIKQTEYQKLLKSNVQLSEISLPLEKIESSLQLMEANFFESDFKVLLQEENNTKIYNAKLGRHFQGVDNKDKHTMSAISCFDNEIIGMMIKNQYEQYNITSTNYINGLILNLNPIRHHHQIGCSTDDWEHYIESTPSLQTRTQETCKRTAISIRVDYQLFLKLKSDTSAVVNYVLSLFNQVNAIYRIEYIQISLSEIIINTKPDGLPHTSANTDLNFIKNNYKNFKGNILLCLSGFTRNGKATLGGVAYINALCLKSYAYAFANVDGIVTGESQFSNDVYLAAHELGHVFGSRHTHACVWGPNKNQAIDNCGTPEGTCAVGPKPTKGTIMSYCNLSGNPGIDFTLGFGKEPGDLMRKNVNAASCLTKYSPTLTDLSKSNEHIKANVECGDGIYTNYYFDNNTIIETDDIFIASINKNGQDIGSVIDGSLSIFLHSSSLYGKSKSNDIKVSYSTKNVILANRYWEINSSKNISKPISVRFNYNSIDLKDIQSIQVNATNDKLSFYSINKPLTAHPDLKHADVTKQHYTEYKFGSSSSLNQWSYTKLNETIHRAEIQISKLNLEFGISYNKANEILGRSTQNDESISLFQNPITHSELRIDYESKSASDLKTEFTLSNLNGNKILNKHFNIVNGPNQISLPIESILNGIYILSIQNINIKKSYQVIVAKSE